MISIQSAMLVALGFLSASLLALVIAPAFWARAVRLTTRRIKDTMPISDVEIRADKDRIRAEYAIKVHKLESEVESVRLAGARQQIEINRRDATVNELEREVDRLKVGIEETTNARRVLEQTVSDRLPRVEARLNEAKKVLYERDSQIAELTRTGERQSRAMIEAQAMNAQQQTEVERLTVLLAGRSRAESPEARSEAELALKAELEALRGKTREQAQLLARMQSLAGRPSAIPVDGAGDGRIAANDAGSAKASDLAEFDRQLRAFKARNEDQSAEIVRLKAALAVFENDTVEDDGKGVLRDSKIGLKARVQALEAQSTQQTDTIGRLRNDLAAANERLARQASHFQNELRRLSAGPASGAASARPSRLSLNDRVKQSHQQAAAPRPAGTSPAVASNVEALPIAAVAAPKPAASAGALDAPDALDVASVSAAGGGPADVAPALSVPAEAEAAPVNGHDQSVSGTDHRPRLIDRLSSLARS